ncbi:hypothetical protein [Streptomyces sp. CFMR 7]|uniref:hypothetical protein n=1 Tax=Streptomyces sp. CFMR 7 TaxID=1649184 RepID=UPI00119E28D3|nr:hypothetical protein [Streptomyces sp. CFMR 7]
MCAAARDVEQVAFVRSDLPWKVCLRHGTWQDGRPEQNVWTPPADAMDWILQTHQRRVTFEQRFGRMGRPLFADAYITVLTWYQQGWVSPGWFARQRSLRGIDSTSLPSIVTYPETVEMAHLLGRYERQRRTGTLDEARWMRQLAETLARWSAPSGWCVRPGSNPSGGGRIMWMPGSPSTIRLAHQAADCPRYLSFPAVGRNCTAIAGCG